MRSRAGLGCCGGHPGILGLILATSGRASSLFRSRGKNRIKESGWWRRGEDLRPESQDLPIGPLTTLHPRTLRTRWSETVGILSAGIGVSRDELLSKINRKRKDLLYQPITLKEDVGVADAFVMGHSFELPEVSVEYQPRRLYREGNWRHMPWNIGKLRKLKLWIRRLSPDWRVRPTRADMMRFGSRYPAMWLSITWPRN